MENKVKNIHQARAIFDLLGIKDVTKDFQSKRGDQVFELPFKTMYANGYKEVNRFTIYKSGYVRKMLVNSKGASWCCYQLNRTRTNDEYYKDYDLNGKWTGKYNKYVGKKRIMIPNHEDRFVYLCNYILKNYYRNQTGASFYRVNDHQVNIIKRLAEEDKARYDEQLPFYEKKDDVQVIINGHRYNLS